jgi:dynein heavy chain 1
MASFFRWQAANIQYRSDIARTEYLSNPNERLLWQSNALPADVLCSENAIMLLRFNRYPLIIDPSGQATELSMNELKDRKITRTSFLDDAFRKNLELPNWRSVSVTHSSFKMLKTTMPFSISCWIVIFGELVDEFSLSLEIRISIFRLRLQFSYPHAIHHFEFPPDICSRVTFVNLTVTRSCHIGSPLTELGVNWS